MTGPGGDSPSADSATRHRQEPVGVCVDPWDTRVARRRQLHATGAVESSAIPHDDAWFCGGGDVAVEAAMDENTVEDWKTSVDGEYSSWRKSVFEEPGSVCQVSSRHRDVPGRQDGRDCFPERSGPGIGGSGSRNGEVATGTAFVLRHIVALCSARITAGITPCV
jgi:hypothetical protein